MEHFEEEFVLVENDKVDNQKGIDSKNNKKISGSSNMKIEQNLDKENQLNHNEKTLKGLNHHDEDDTDDMLAQNELPIFANEQNKALFHEIKEIEEKIKKVSTQVSDQTERYQIMVNHTKHIQQEMEYTNNLIDAKANEIKTESHLLSLVEREKGRLKVDIRALEADELQHREEIKNVEIDILKATEEINSFRESMNWNNEQITQWSEKAAETEADNIALQKYSKEDDVKIKELQLAIEKLTAKSILKKAQEENAQTERQIQRTELERSSEIFKQSHNERKQLITKWQDAIEAIRERDKEINKAAEDYTEAKANLEISLSVLKNNRNEYTLQQADTKDITQAIDDGERLLQLRRQERMDQIKVQQEANDELNGLRNELNVVMGSLDRQIIQNNDCKAQLEAKQISFEQATKQLSKIKAHLAAQRKKCVKEEKNALTVEDSLVDRELQLRKADKQIEVAKHLLFKEQESLSNLSDKQRILEADLKSSCAQTKILSSKIRELDAEVLRQQELSYNAQYQLFEIQRKVARGLGERSDEEQLKLKQEIKNLNAKLSEYEKKRKILSTQYKVLQSDLRRWTQQEREHGRKQEVIKERINEINLEISSCENSLKNKIIEKEELSVKFDLVRADIVRSRDLLLSQTKRVAELEEKKRTSKSNTMTRKRDLLLKKDMRIAEKRALEEERHHNALELAQRKVVEEKLRSKYEVLTNARMEQTDSSENSHIYKLIRAAQRKEELQIEGDELDRKIQVKEKELFALQKTLAHLKEQNTSLRKSYSRVDMKSKEGKEFTSLQKQVAQEKDALICERSKLRHIENEFDKQQATLEELTCDVEARELELSTLQVNRRKLILDLEQSKYRLDIALGELNNQIIDYRKGESEMQPEEKIGRCKIFEQSIDSVVQVLTESLEEFPQFRVEIEKLIAMCKIIPSSGESNGSNMK